jgi:peptidyl-dipeptidase Dcp
MSRRLIVPVTAAAVLSLAGCAPMSSAAAEDEGAEETADTFNPFFIASPLPYGMPQFDLIRDEHFLPAYERGMAEELAEVEAIANNPEPPTFDNTIVAMERSGGLHDRVNRVFSNLNSAHTNPTMQEIQQTVSPQRAAHQDAIYLDSALFARIESLHEQRDALGLDAESKRLLERYHTDFVRAGARLSEEDKDKLRALNQELASLGSTFSRNVLQETVNSAVLVDSAEELDGFSSAEIQAAADAALARGHEDKYLITLQNTTGQPPLTSLTNRALRQRIHEASVNRGARDNEHDNRPVVARTAALRAERAALLGYPNHAAYVREN